MFFPHTQALSFKLNIYIREMTDDLHDMLLHYKISNAVTLLVRSGISEVKSVFIVGMCL